MVIWSFTLAFHSYAIVSDGDFVFRITMSVVSLLSSLYVVAAVSLPRLLSDGDFTGVEAMAVPLRSACTMIDQQTRRRCFYCLSSILWCSRLRFRLQCSLSGNKCMHLLILKNTRFPGSFLHSLVSTPTWCLQRYSSSNEPLLLLIDSFDSSVRSPISWSTVQ